LELLQSCFSGFNSIEYQKGLGVKLADSLATKETVLLFYNLKNLSQNKIIFGHQHSTAYGVGWKGDEDRSDVKDVVDAYPGLYGWDFGSITPLNNISNDWMKKYVVDAYKRGGINTFCWHYNNPVSGGSFYDTTIAVKHILPGGSHHNEYLKSLDSDSIKIAYVMVWRNADKKHHYAPYKGQKSEKDFIDFKNSPKILFEDRLPNLYKYPLGKEI
jgi:mannan endo-1,4-beta-mannosidase